MNVELSVLRLRIVIFRFYTINKVKKRTGFRIK
jgi:hypothetical protein